jgi:hypothetical protein
MSPPSSICANLAVHRRSKAIDQVLRQSDFEPRPGRMGPALRSGGGSGIDLPSSTLGA